MTLPLSRSTSYVPGNTPTIKSQDLNDLQDWLAYLYNTRGYLRFGDGSDGAATMDGTTTIAGMSPLFNAYSATRDLHFTTLTINSGVTLKMNGFRLYVSGATGVDSALVCNGAIRCDASGQVGGGSNGVLGAAGSGANGGGIGGTGNAGATVTAALGGAGGAGGAGNGGFTGGAGGTLTAPTAAQGSIHVPMSLLTGLLFGASGAIAVNGGSGGGGGGGAATTNAGANGGGPGGVLLIAARTAYFGASAVVSAVGASGGAGGGSGSTGSGSGGGGGGGAVILVYQALGSGSVTPSSIITVAGGAGGVGGNANGTAGGAGHSYIITPN